MRKKNVWHMSLICSKCGSSKIINEEDICFYKHTVDNYTFILYVICGNCGQKIEFDKDSDYLDLIPDEIHKRLDKKIEKKFGKPDYIPIYGTEPPPYW